jgi:hypothetical protein
MLAAGLLHHGIHAVCRRMFRCKWTWRKTGFSLGQSACVPVAPLILHPQCQPPANPWAKWASKPTAGCAMVLSTAANPLLCTCVFGREWSLAAPSSHERMFVLKVQLHTYSYGGCLVANIDTMKKDACAKEFDAFRACVQRAV